MEQLLHYVWRHRILPVSGLLTTDGKPVEVIDPGLHNSNAGPDFFNAKVRIDGTLWVGNVEIHDKSSDWYLHGHDKDAHYDNVVLHVARPHRHRGKNLKGRHSATSEAGGATLCEHPLPRVAHHRQVSAML